MGGVRSGWLIAGRGGGRGRVQAEKRCISKCVLTRPAWGATGGHIHVAALQARGEWAEEYKVLRHFK